MVAYYREVGFLPAAVLNGLSRLGWSLDDKTENMSLEFVVDNFSLDRVVKSPAGLDPDKLLAYQEYWIGQCSLEEKIDKCLPFLQRAGYVSESVDPMWRAQIGKLIAALGDRLKLFSDILSYDEYFVADDNLSFDEKAFKKRIIKPERGTELLAKYRDELKSIDDFDATNLEARFKTWLEANDLGFGDIIHALRVAVTGKPAGPAMFDCLELIGKESCLKRIDRAIAAASN